MTKRTLSLKFFLVSLLAVAGCELMTSEKSEFQFKETKTQEEINEDRGAQWKELNFPAGWTISNVRPVSFTVLAPTAATGSNRTIRVLRPDGTLLMTANASDIPSAGISLRVPHQYTELVVKEGLGDTETQYTVGIDTQDRAEHRLR